MIEPVAVIHQLSWALHYHVDKQQGQVTTTLAGTFESRAVDRDGIGCLVLRGPDPVPVSSSDVAADATGAALLPEIAGSMPVEATDAYLRAALDDAFREPDQPRYRQTKHRPLRHIARSPRGHPGDGAPQGGAVSLCEIS